MKASVYLHPQRLLIALWDNEDGVPVLTTYLELDPAETVNLADLGAKSVDAIMHSSNVHVHWYPVDVVNPDDVAHDFEQQAWFSSGLLSPLPSVTMHTVIGGQQPMTATVLGDSSVVDRIQQLCVDVPGYALHVDLDLDLQFAIKHTKPRSSQWMIIGRRAERWHAAIVSPAHVITSVSTFQHDIDYSNAEMIELIYNKLCDRYACSIDSALVFGDVVTSDEIGNLKHHDALRAIKIGRLHPFRHVHTNLDQLHSERIIKRAHVVSPLAGVVLTASKS